MSRQDGEWGCARSVQHHVSLLTRDNAVNLGRNASCCLGLGWLGSRRGCWRWGRSTLQDGPLGSLALDRAAAVGDQRIGLPLLQRACQQLRGLQVVPVPQLCWVLRQSCTQDSSVSLHRLRHEGLATNLH